QQQYILALADALGVQRFRQFDEGHAVFDRGPDATPQQFLPQGGDVEAQRLVGGVGMLTERLRTALPAGSIADNERVTMIADDAGGLLITTQTEGGRVTYEAQQAVVTLPPRLAA